ncbi:hypothetical protein ACLOJK_016119 [Asimina triloba]
MAALQQSPVVFQAKTPPSARLRIRCLAQTPLRSSFHGKKLSSCKLAEKLAVKLRLPARRGGVKMMQTVAESYARALADVAKANGTLDATSADAEKLETIFSDPPVYGFFVNPVIDSNKKQAMIEEITTSSNLQPHVVNFLNILLDSNRIDLINEIVKEFELIYNELTNTEMALVTSVVKLDSQNLTQIAQTVQKLTGAKNVRIKTQNDPSLVAGFTIRYGSSGSKLIDMSVKKQLDELSGTFDFSEVVGSLVD